MSGNTPSREPGENDVRRASSRIVSKQRIMPLRYGGLLRAGAEADEAGALAQFKARFGPDSRLVPIGRARTGIYLLTHLAVSDTRRKVLMSPYTLPDLINMVTLAGGEPVFYDFEPSSTFADIEDLARRIDEQTACVFVTHYHVNEPRLGDIAALCQAKGARLFDDCAIAFGGTTEGGPVGTLTEASVFSFSSFKLLNFFWGGLIVTTDSQLADRLDGIVGTWPRLAGRAYWPQVKACLRYDLASRPAPYGQLIFPAMTRKLRKDPNAKGLEHVRIETDSLDSTILARPSLAAFREWDRKLARLDDWLSRRRRLARIYRDKLNAHAVGGPLSERQIEGGCFSNFPVLAPTGSRGRIVRRMKLLGYDVGANLYPNAQRHPGFEHLPGETGSVDRLVADGLYLPTHLGVDEAYAEEIAGQLAAELG